MSLRENRSALAAAAAAVARDSDVEAPLLQPERLDSSPFNKPKPPSEAGSQASSVRRGPRDAKALWRSVRRALGEPGLKRWGGGGVRLPVCTECRVRLHYVPPTMHRVRAGVGPQQPLLTPFRPPRPACCRPDAAARGGRRLRRAHGCGAAPARALVARPPPRAAQPSGRHVCVSVQRHRAGHRPGAAVGQRAAEPRAAAGWVGSPPGTGAAPCCCAAEARCRPHRALPATWRRHGPLRLRPLPRPQASPRPRPTCALWATC